MRLKDYFAGESLQLRSTLSPQRIAELINQAAGSSIWPFTTGVVGGVWSGHIRLRCRSSVFEYNAKPVLSGRIDASPTGSILELRYRAPVWIYVFYVVWYLFLALLAARLLSSGWPPDMTGGDKAMVLAIFLGLLVGPLGLHLIGTRNSSDELHQLIEFLADHAGATHNAC